MSEARGRAGSHPSSVAEDGDAVGNRFDFGETVRDVEQRHALRLQVGERAKQRVHFVRRQDRGRLVEDDHPVRHQECAGDLDHLPLGDRQPPDEGVGRGRAAERREALGRDPSHRRAIKKKAASLLASEKQVLGDRELAGEELFLMDQHDAMPLGVRRGRKPDRHAVQQDFARVRLLISAEQLDEGRFAGTVLAEDGAQFAACHRDVDLL